MRQFPKLPALFLILCTALCIATTPSHAQEEEDSEGMLVGFLENTLSTDGSYIKVTGLQGALSSKATIGGLTVADDDGVWLSISNAQLDWNRLALLRGRFSVNALTADKIEVLRRPTPVPADPSLPTPETKPFELPKLPVSVEIGELRISDLHLAEALTGTEANLALAGSVKLADGALDSQITATRLDRPGDQIGLLAQFSNDTRLLTIDLAVDEGQGGLLSTLIGLPDAPPLQLSVKGDGPLTDFLADIRLATEDQDRLTGTVRLQGVTLPNADPGTPQSIAFDANLSGDVTPVLPADFHDFFGTQTALTVKGQSDPGGGLSVETFDLSSQALRLSGALELQPGGDLRKVKLRGSVTPPKGDRVVLPMAQHTTLGNLTLSADLDADVGNDWRLNLSADRLNHPSVALNTAQIAANGTLVQTEATRFAGTIDGTLNGISFTDPALRDAVGTVLSLNGGFATNGEGAMQFDDLELAGSDYTARVNGTVSGLQTGFEVDGNARVAASDLGRFSGLAGMDLTGNVTAQATGAGAPLGGAFDVKLNVLGQDLGIGHPKVDPLMTGQSTLELDATRGADGFTLRNFDLSGDVLNATATGQWNKTDSKLDLDAKLDDLGLVVPDFSGPVTLRADLKQVETLLSGALIVTGPRDSRVNLTGDYDTEGAADIDFDARLAELKHFVPQVEGPLTANGKATLTDGFWKTRAHVQGPHSSFADLTGSIDPKGDVDVLFDAALGQMERFVPQVPGAVSANGQVSRKGTHWTGEGKITGPHSSSAKLEGEIEESGEGNVTFDMTLNGLERFVPALPGSLTANGTANRKGSVWTVNADGTGPAGMTAGIRGDYNQDNGTADMSLAGQIRMDIANLFISPNQMQGLATFDLRLNGAPSLSALGGTVRIADTTMAIPSVAQELENISATITLADSSATVNANGALRAGGGFTVTGPVALTPPFDGQLVLNLNNLVLTDQVSFESSAAGQIRMTGPMAGNANIAGQITFGETQINLNAVSGGVSAAPIPQITHVGDPAAVIATRKAAGLVDTGEDRGGGPVYGLDIDLLAPNKVFANGFGLQAELGGALNIGGTTAEVNPTGQITLVRGTLDVVGRRLKLTKGIVSLQGDLSPYVEFESSASTSDGQATFQIAGPIDSPKVSVFSDPERPPEEALAMLLFGNRFSELSPFVIAQMAASLAAMSGAGSGAKNEARKKSGLDVLDVGTDESGAGRAGAGAYLSDNIYTDLSVNTRGETELNLNLDLTDSLTVRGTVDGRGESGVGVFFERNY